MPTSTVLICRAGGIAMALPLDQVMGVAPPSPVTPLPFCPDAVEGLVLTMGLAVVQVSVPTVLGLPPVVGGVLTIVRRGDDVRALRLDAVVAMAELDAAAPDAAAADDGAPRWFAGTVAWRGEAVPVLDIEQVWAAADLPTLGAAGRGRTAPVPLANRDGAARPDGSGPSGDAPSDQNAHLLLDIGGELYATSTDRVIELLPVGSARPVPGAPHWVAGLIDRRGAPVLAIDARVLLGHPASGAGRLALLIDHGADGIVALLVDHALAISYIDRADTHAMREATAGVTHYTVDGEGRIVGVIDVAALLSQVSDRLAGLVPSPARRDPAQSHGVQTGPARAVEGERALVIKVRGDLFAVPLDRVERILPAVTVSRLPFDGNGFDGVIDIGELPVPVLDLRGTDERAAGQRAPCTLVRVEGATAGLVVDEVLQIENPSRHAIEDVVADEGLPISGVFDVRGRAVAMLMLDRLLPILS